MFALYSMLVIWHWLEREQSGLFIQLQLIDCVLFPMIHSLLCALIINFMFAM